MDKELYLYGLKYPTLCIDILNFFRDDSIQSMYIDRLVRRMGNTILTKQVRAPLDFISNHTHYKNLKEDAPIQPETINAICSKLSDLKMLEKINMSDITTFAKEGDFYCIFGKHEKIQYSPQIQQYLNNLVYGFRYIYESSRTKILPIYVFSAQQNQSSIGTCFISTNGIVTAKHCLEKYDYACIPGIDTDLLNNAKILCNDKVDLALICFDNIKFFLENGLLFGKGSVLDDVLALGYPTHAGFDNFLTATTGQITAIENSYIYKHNLMLLTGKIKGGNSGGPVLNGKGEVVGIITETPDPEGDYDKFGYGVAIPSEYVDDLNTLYDKKIKFDDNINKFMY